MDLDALTDMWIKVYTILLIGFFLGMAIGFIHYWLFI